MNKTRSFLVGAVILFFLLPVFFSCENGGVIKTDPTVTWPQDLMANKGQALSEIALDSHTNDEGTPGAFSWTKPTVVVGMDHTPYNMTFTPTDTAIYNTVTNDVAIHICDDDSDSDSDSDTDTDPTDPPPTENETGVFWKFNTNGTGGKATTKTGTFSNDFSFFVYEPPTDPARDPEVAQVNPFIGVWKEIGQATGAPPEGSSLVMVSGNTNDASAATVTRYVFSITGTGNQATATLFLAPVVASVSTITLQRVDGAPQSLSLSNPLIGEWHLEWSLGTGVAWSFKYRTDGTVKTNHHTAHQFENAYALRDNTLVIFGQYRYGGLPTNKEPVAAQLSLLANGKYQASETRAVPPANGTNRVVFTYNKVDKATWK